MSNQNALQDKDKFLDPSLYDTYRDDQDKLEEQMNEDQGFQTFSKFHGVQLRALGVPINLHYQVYQKLTSNVFDIGEKVQLVLDQEAEKMHVRALEEMQAVSNIYLIDHVWTFKQSMILNTLMKEDDLVTRLRNLMRYSRKQDLPCENTFLKPRP